MLRCRLWRLCDFLWQLNSAVTGVIIRSRGARQLRASCAQSRVSPAGHQEWKRLRLSVCRSLDHSGKDLTCFYTFCKQENLWLGSTWQSVFYRAACFTFRPERPMKTFRTFTSYKLQHNTSATATLKTHRVHMSSSRWWLKKSSDSRVWNHNKLKAFKLK